MNRKHAKIDNYTVFEFFYPETQEEIRNSANLYIILDVEDYPEVQIGWFYTGNKLVSMDSPEAIKFIENNLAKNTLNPSGSFGEFLVKDIRDKIGARNLRLNVTESEIQALVSSLISIRFLLEGAALKTARGVLQTIKPLYPQYSDILQEAVDKITGRVGL